MMKDLERTSNVFFNSLFIRNYENIEKSKKKKQKKNQNIKTRKII